MGQWSFDTLFYILHHEEMIMFTMWNIHKTNRNVGFGFFYIFVSIKVRKKPSHVIQICCVATEANRTEWEVCIKYKSRLSTINEIIGNNSFSYFKSCHPGGHILDYTPSALPIKSLQLIWRSGIPRFHLRVPCLLLSYTDLTASHGITVTS